MANNMLFIWTIVVGELISFFKEIVFLEYLQLIYYFSLKESFSIEDGIHLEEVFDVII